LWFVLCRCEGLEVLLVASDIVWYWRFLVPGFLLVMCCFAILLEVDWCDEVGCD
jgi:hypothetical protein